MEKAKEVLDALEAELEAAMVKVPVTAVQVEVLMENKAAMLVAARGAALHGGDRPRTEGGEGGGA